ncbi:hypothetical protein DFJ73DRAFT_799659 [Zopfochytrium polystomum]|nr:hypothetical protein DFJ73DRAFT_799659 [Zopfochytrium polystomum]
MPRDKMIRVFDLHLGQEVQKMIGHQGAVNGVAYSPDGRLVASASYDTTLKTWSPATGQVALTFIGHTGEVNAVAFSPDGSRILSGSSDKTIRVWNASTGEQLQILTSHHTEVHTVAYSPDRRFFVSGGYDQLIRVWSATSDEGAQDQGGHSKRVTCATLSPSKDLAASGSADKTVRIWDVTTGTELHKMEGHRGAVERVAFTPDGRFVLSNADDRSLRVWSVEAGREVHKFTARWDDAIVASVGADGRFVAFGRMDRPARVWDSATGQEFQRLIPEDADVAGGTAAGEADPRTTPLLGHRATWREVISLQDPPPPPAEPPLGGAAAAAAVDAGWVYRDQGLIPFWLPPELRGDVQLTTETRLFALGAGMALSMELPVGPSINQAAALVHVVTDLDDETRLYSQVHHFASLRYLLNKLGPLVLRQARRVLLGVWTQRQLTVRAARAAIAAGGDCAIALDNPFGISGLGLLGFTDDFGSDGACQMAEAGRDLTSRTPVSDGGTWSSVITHVAENIVEIGLKTCGVKLRAKAVPSVPSAQLADYWAGLKDRADAARELVKDFYMETVEGELDYVSLPALDAILAHFSATRCLPTHFGDNSTPSWLTPASHLASAHGGAGGNASTDYSSATWAGSTNILRLRIIYKARETFLGHETILWNASWWKRSEKSQSSSSSSSVKHMPSPAVIAGLLGAASLASASPVDRTVQLSRRNTAVNLVLDPSYQQPSFEGWGTSLAWLGVVTGGYPDAIRNQLVDMVFGPNGLNLNIARYNVGGGNAPSVPNYLRAGGAVPGWWNSPNATYGPNDKDWWDPTNPDHWNFDADPNQRWWVDQIKDRVTHFEAFSNSPPWFQTVSGYVSGGFSATDEQIRSDKVADFATYLVKVVEKLEEVHGINVKTIDPVNEPNTNYWKTTLTNGVPSASQEGCHVGPTMQSNVATALKNRLASSSSNAVVSAPDETNPSTFITDFYGWDSTGAASVGQLNVHSYGTDLRVGARDIAKSAGLPLWMSEVEGSWGNDFTSMNSGLGMAQHIVDDIRLLEPTAWVLWQPIEDRWNMVREGNLQWGEIHVPFNCTASSTVNSDCAILTNTKYHAVRQFTHYIRPNDRFIRIASDTNTVAAVKGDGSSGVVVVHVNSDTVAHDLTLDFSGFASVAADASVTPIVSSSAGALVRGAAVAVASNKAVVTVPASSVSTLLVSGVSGVRDSAALIRVGAAYRVQGVQSGKYLQPSADGSALVIASLNASSTAQRWSFRRIAGAEAYSSRDRFVIVNAAKGTRLTVSASGAAAVPAASQWMVSTPGDGTFTVVNAGVRGILDVGGQSTAENASVGTYRPNGQTNQQWKITAV